jgi:hypothetical protein
MLAIVVSGLLIATGVLAVGIGVTVASHRVRSARRAHHLTAVLCAGHPDAWRAWFLDGFSGLTLGTRWLSAAGALGAWGMAGACLIGLGLRVF